MPRYDIKCVNEKCEQFEQIHALFLSLSELEHVKCSECGEPAKQVIGVIPVHFKGKGWADKDGA